MTSNYLGFLKLLLLAFVLERHTGGGWRVKQLNDPIKYKNNLCPIHL